MLGDTTSSAHGFNADRDYPDASVEKRIEHLVKNISRIDDRITQTQREMEMMKTEAQATLKREEQTRISQDSEIWEKLEATETGGLNISFIGAVLLLLGMFLGSSSIEIARVLH